jgi:hypothetical protein
MSGKRRQVHWSMEARDLVAEHLVSRCNTSDDPGSERAATRTLISKLVELTGNPRDACYRFVRRFGIAAREDYRGWTKAEQEQLLDLIVLHPPSEVAKTMRRSIRSIRSMLHKLGSCARTGRNWFTKFSLASALHTRADEVQKWIDQGWLKARLVDTGRLKKVIIDPDDFAQFCKRYRDAAIGRRFNAERLEFLRSFVFSPSHGDWRPGEGTKEEQIALKAKSEASKQTKECKGSGSSCTVTA